MWFIGVEVEQETSAPPPKKNPGSAPCSITSHITCNAKNVIYMVQCNRCNLQYIGETKRRLKDRFNEHRRALN